MNGLERAPKSDNTVDRASALHTAYPGSSPAFCMVPSTARNDSQVQSHLSAGGHGPKTKTGQRDNREDF